MPAQSFPVEPSEGRVRRVLKPFLPGAFIFWSALVCGKFLETHPLKPGAWLAQLGRLNITGLRPTGSGAAYIASHVCALLLFMGAAYLMGRKVRSWLRLDDLGRLEAFVYAMGLGLGSLVLISFFLGIFGLYYRSIIYAGGMVVFALSLRDVKARVTNLNRPIGRSLEGIGKALSSINQRPLATMLVVLLILQCLVSFSFSLTPAMDWDSLNYHLNVPNRYAHTHGMSPTKFLIPSYMPHNIDLLYALGILGKDFVLAKNVSFATGLLVLLYVYAFCKRYFGDGQVPLIAAFITLFTHDVVHVLGLSYVDFGMTLFYLLSVGSVIRWHESGESKWLALGGVFSGLALGAKYTVLPGIIALLISAFLLSLYKERRVVRAIRPAVVFAVFVAAAMLPWLIRNGVALGNPVYPLLYPVFGGRDFSAGLNARWNAYFGTGFGLGRSFFDYLLLPWNMTVKGNFGFRNFGSIIPPVWLIFIPFIVFVAKPRGVILFLGGICALCFVWWASRVQFTRYLFYIYPFLGIITAYCAHELFLAGGCISGRRLSLSLRLIVVALLLFSALSILLPYTANVVSGYLPVVLGSEPREDFSRRVVSNYEVFDYINRTLPPDAKVLFLWENRTFYCNREIVGDHYFTISSVFEFVFPPDSSVEGILRRLNETYHVTHIFENTALRTWCYVVQGGPFFIDVRQRRDFERSEALLEEFKARYCEKILSKEGVNLYRINYPGKQSLGGGQ